MYVSTRKSRSICEAVYKLLLIVVEFQKDVRLLIFGVMD